MQKEMDIRVRRFWRKYYMDNRGRLSFVLASREFLAFENILWITSTNYLKEAAEQLDARILLRVPHDVLKQRRQARHGYHTAGEGYAMISSNTTDSSPRHCHNHIRIEYNFGKLTYLSPDFSIILL